MDNGNEIDAGYVGVKEGSESTATYTVVFKDWDGTILKTETVAAGKSATAPTAPDREGYVFSKWDKIFTNVTSNMIVTAQYTKITTPAYIVGSATASAGATNVNIAVSIKNNPGFLTLASDIIYDSEALTLTKVVNGSQFGEYSFTPPKNKKSGCRAAWFSTDLPEEIVDGDIMILQFTVLPEAKKGKYAITISCPNDDSTVDGNKSAFIFSSSTGYITVE